MKGFFFLATNTNSTDWGKHSSIFFSFSNAGILVSSTFFRTGAIRFHCFYIAYSAEVSGFLFPFSSRYIL